MLYQVAPSNSCNCKKVLIVLGITLLACYNLAIGIYEVKVGGDAAKLVADYYDYSYQFPNITLSIAIDALPRDIYKNTKDTAGTMITFGVIAICLQVWALVLSACKADFEQMYWSFAADLSAVVAPFCLAAFLTWKVHSLSSKDIATWDAIDPLFIENLWRMQSILIATLVPGVIWTVVACFIYCSK